MIPRIGPIGIVALGLLAALGAGQAARAAEDLGEAAGLDKHYPAGSIVSRDSADAALAEADKADHEVSSRFDRERVACMKTFLVNHCLDGARKRQMAAQRVVLRVQVEAHDWERADDATKRAAQRVQDDQTREAQAPAREQQEHESMRAADQRNTDNATHRADLARQQADGPAKRTRFDEKQVEHAADIARSNSPQAQTDRANNVKQLGERREQAAEHAQQVADDRKVNQQKREERRKSLAADEERRLHPPPRDD